MLCCVFRSHAEFRLKKARKLTIQQLSQSEGQSEPVEFTSTRELIQLSRVWTTLTVIATAFAIIVLLFVAAIVADLLPSYFEIRLRDLPGTIILLWNSSVFSIAGVTLQAMAGILFVIWTSSARKAARHIGLLPMQLRESSRRSYYNFYLDSFARAVRSVRDVYDLLIACSSKSKEQGIFSRISAGIWGASYLVASALSLTLVRYDPGRVLLLSMLLLWVLADMLAIYMILGVMKSEEQSASVKRNIESPFVDVADGMGED
jgi:hypothetical protein